MKFKYKDQIVTASSKVEAIKKLSEISEKDKKDIFRRAKRGDKSILKLPPASLMIMDNFGNTPVSELAEKGIKEILDLPAKLLVQKDDDGLNPIHRLAQTGCKKVLDLPEKLLRTKTDYNETPVHFLAQEGVKDIFKLPISLLLPRSLLTGRNVIETFVDFNEGIVIPKKFKQYINDIG